MTDQGTQSLCFWRSSQLWTRTVFCPINNNVLPQTWLMCTVGKALTMFGNSPPLPKIQSFSVPVVVCLAIKWDVNVTVGSFSSLTSPQHWIQLKTKWFAWFFGFFFLLALSHRHRWSKWTRESFRSPRCSSSLQKLKVVAVNVQVWTWCWEKEKPWKCIFT